MHTETEPDLGAYVDDAAKADRAVASTPAHRPGVDPEPRADRRRWRRWSWNSRSPTSDEPAPVFRP